MLPPSQATLLEGAQFQATQKACATFFSHRDGARGSTGFNYQTYGAKSRYKHTAKSQKTIPMKHIGLNQIKKHHFPSFPIFFSTLDVVQLLPVACGEQRASPPRQAPPWIRNSTGRSAESVEGTYQRSSGTWRPGVVPGLPGLGLARNGR